MIDQSANIFFAFEIHFTPWSRGRASAKHASNPGFKSHWRQFFFFFKFILFAIFFIDINSKFMILRYSEYTNRIVIIKLREKKVKGFFLWRDSNPRQVREQNVWKIFIFFDRLNQKTLKNHISFWVSHFRYMDGTLGSALTWIFTWYHPYTGSGTPRRKYDFISKSLLSKSEYFWYFLLKAACFNQSNLH